MDNGTQGALKPREHVNASYDSEKREVSVGLDFEPAKQKASQALSADATESSLTAGMKNLFKTATDSASSYLPDAGSLLGGIKDVLSGGDNKDDRAGKKGSNDGYFADHQDISTVADYKPLKSQVAKPDESSKTDEARDKTTSQFEKIAEKAKEHLESSENPVHDISEAVKQLDNLRAGSMKRNGDGSFHIEGHTEQPGHMDPVDIGRRFFRAGPSQVSTDFSFDMKPTDSGFSLSNMSGFTGSVTGPLGRTRGTRTNSMTVGKDQYGPYLDVNADAFTRRRAINNSMRLRESALPDGSPLKALMNEPEQLKTMASSMRMFQNASDLNKVEIEKRSEGNFHIATEASSGRHVEVHEKVGKLGLEVNSIDVDKALSADLTRDKDGVALDNIDGMTVNVKSLLGEMKIQPIKVGIKNGADGKPVVELEIKNPNMDNVKVDMEVDATGEKHRLEEATVKIQLPLEKLREPK